MTNEINLDRVTLTMRYGTFKRDLDESISRNVLTSLHDTILHFIMIDITESMYDVDIESVHLPTTYPELCQN